MEFVYLIVGLLIGAVSLYLIFTQKLKSDKNIISHNEKMLSEEKVELKKELQDKAQVIIELNKDLAAKKADYGNLLEKLNTQKKEIEKLQEKFTLEFKNLANEIFDDKSKKFTEQNKLNLSDILKPLNEKIKDFEKKVEETYDKESQQRFSLKEEVKRLAELNQQISKEASNLTKALKGDTKSQGLWGEVILENILEKSGLVKDREYFIQASFSDKNGKRLQPDVLIKYPGDRNVIVDSKVSLTAYDRYVAAEDDIKKANALKEHLNSVKTHINLLSDKNYQDIYQLKSLDFVMMFLPVEPAYLIAIQTDSELWQYAYEKRILLISPTNLIAALKMVVSLWRQEYQNRNAEEIARRSGDLYDKFVGLIEDLIDVGNKLKQTQNSYEASMNKLSTGKGNLVKKAQDLKQLGIKTKKELPNNIIEKANG